VSAPSVLVGDDGRARCRWGATDSEYRRYHDEEWGVPLHGDRPLFEKISLEAFQAGLSWITILRRRKAFRAAFDGFDIDAVAAYGDRDVERLLDDVGIIRNRAKVVTTIANARVTRDLVRDDPGALDRLIWSFAPSPARPRPETLDEIPAETDESGRLSAALRALGYRFIGPTTMYALMQSAGLVDDHVADCWRAT
jgi:DNA-3-methyladenine glycosylase I